MKRNQIILILAFLAVIGIVLWNGMGSDKQEAQATTEQQAGGTSSVQEELKVAPVQGSLAPSFQLSSIDKSISYEVGGQRDKLLIINFWASWCGPCDMEAPDLQKIYEKYGDKVDLYAVNATKYDTVRGAKDFVKEKEIEFPVMLDEDGKVGDDYKVFSYPISFIVDKDGVVRERIEGIQPLEKWETMLDGLLKA
ncbi:TlpA family protein disulfide reductase [Cohnella thailandensis]|uniref:TlpA family protein disulfide reductase n=1 Tax=Cohnella thailandensis TaxID=557557 RepID=A0A841SUX9_9BACL|nr:TlpA disulfide reductase family protein [Cohnella thailandensis]MBB6634008.1 TlpA family protein disulfide reductase [Cohnella thailandensis]MBP1972693.1 thiol-disulfide isomerase/thioredoxin [Cohnella thailandensis]